MSGLAIVGHTALDRFGDEAPRPGGAPLYAARALHAAAETALVVTRCAEEELVEPIRALGLPLLWTRSPTPAFRLEYRGGGRKLAIDALGEPWTLDDARGWLGDALAGVRWVHLGALWRDEFPVEVVAALAAGRRLSLDGQCLVRAGRVGVVRLEGALDRDLLAHVDVLHLSVEEAAALGVALDAGALEEVGVPEVVVTLGEEGSLLWHTGRAERVPATPVADADPTGAGDGFMAVYLAGRCAGAQPGAAAERATAVVHDLLARGRG